MGFHVHLYLGVAVFVLSAIPFFSVIFLSGGFNASTDALVGAIVAVAVLHMALLAFVTRRCSTEKLRYWDGMRLHCLHDVWNWRQRDGRSNTLRASGSSGINRNRSCKSRKATVELGAATPLLVVPMWEPDSSITLM